MQYTTTDIISDNQSIDLAIDKLFSYYSKENNRSAAVSSAIGAYNRGSDYLFEVYAIYNQQIERLSILYLGRDAKVSRPTILFNA